MITKDKALVYLINDLESTKKCFPAAGKDARALRVLQETAEALKMAIDALQDQEKKEQQPLTMAELRKMDGETVYCLELNTEVKIHARKYGFINVSYKFPGEYGEFKAMGLTLYRARPEDLK